MDHFPDQAFSLGSWSQIQMGALDFNGRTVTKSEDVGHQKSPKILSQTSSRNYTVGDSMQLLLDDSTRLLYQQQGFQDSLADASASQAPLIVAPPSVNSTGAGILGSTQIAAGGQLPATWCQPFVGGALPLEFGAGQAKIKCSPQQEGSLMSVCGGHVGSSQAQSAGTVSGSAARPRARARRGQATDPHSIAERLRRERIAVRMKSLQELVPNSNKADRASMLDEIIEYVKFLQLQVKVLSMSRLGGSNAITPLLSDLTTEGLLSPGVVPSPGATGSQDGVAVVERQVARLMEENMGLAMQFLQGKGLCLMPLSLAAAMSCTNSISQTLHQVEIESSPGECRQIDITGAIPAASKTAGVVFGSIATSPNSNDGMGAN